MSRDSLMSKEPNPAGPGEKVITVGVRMVILRTDAELESVREEWASWQRHPNADLDFFRTINRARAEVISPYVIALYRSGVLETLLVGRLERGYVPLDLGYWRLLQIPVRNLTFIYGGLLGNTSVANCEALVREAQACLVRERAHVMWLHFVRVDSEMYRAARRNTLIRRDFFAESRPHWVMKLPSDVERLYEKMSPKARANRRYEARRLAKEFGTVQVECYEGEADLEHVLSDAESIACRTYQRGLGVGFVANAENLERFRIEAQRGQFRGYILHFDGKAVAFFLGTLHKNVLYDNFTAYDPDFSKYSPGTYLFFQIFERLCRDRVEAVDFGFGDAWYKAQFGTEKAEEVTVCLFAPCLKGLAISAIRLPVSTLDVLGKKAVKHVAFLRSVKKKWRDRAAKRVTE